MQRDIPLQGARNVRDLGGLHSRTGRTLRTHRFVRADSLEALHAIDVIQLLDYGVRMDIDLRGQRERRQWGDALSRVAEIQYAPISLLDGLDQHLDNVPASLGTLYVDVLRYCRHGFLAIFRQILSQPEGCVLFHCSAGKDRTGMVAALLLNLAGVPDEDIIADYTRSATNLHLALAQFGEQNAPELRHLLGAEPEHMVMFLDHLRRHYDGAVGYLTLIGLDPSEIGSLRASMFD
ncbi:tyrosine-protein phosphatase [Silvimonas iriomotensis]|uniref:Protein-tyrosine-phosphatase n=1 Tax=Silvimonas iriomotensis TaxID=449662 RepID=A0ABQ2PAL0_9NEIS|nr:tyrosine-protein phosphatase [Silvimonas iriomotensis]GGP21925.1 protein-tyrosine-phosphatase [Silvimonas iriomotensis]